MNELKTYIIGIPVRLHEKVTMIHTLKRMEYKRRSKSFLSCYSLLLLHSQKGPMAVDVPVGEYQVIRSIIEYSMPRLVGWTSLMDHSIEQSFKGTDDFFPSPHNYGSYDGNDVPF